MNKKRKRIINQFKLIVFLIIFENNNNNNNNNALVRYDKNKAYFNNMEYQKLEVIKNRSRFYELIHKNLYNDLNKYSPFMEHNRVPTKNTAIDIRQAIKLTNDINNRESLKIILNNQYNFHSDYTINGSISGNYFSTINEFLSAKIGDYFPGYWEKFKLSSETELYLNNKINQYCFDNKISINTLTKDFYQISYIINDYRNKESYHHPMFLEIGPLKIYLHICGLDLYPKNIKLNEIIHCPRSEYQINIKNKLTRNLKKNIIIKILNKEI